MHLSYLSVSVIINLDRFGMPARFFHFVSLTCGQVAIVIVDMANLSAQRLIRKVVVCD